MDKCCNQCVNMFDTVYMLIVYDFRDGLQILIYEFLGSGKCLIGWFIKCLVHWVESYIDA